MICHWFLIYNDNAYEDFPPNPLKAWCLGAPGVAPLSLRLLMTSNRIRAGFDFLPHLYLYSLLEEIKIISVPVFVNPYSESDEEEEKKTEEEKLAEDEENEIVGSWYSNPGTGATETAASGGGVGKYLKARNTKVESALALDNGGQSSAVVKKRKLGVTSQELEDFSAWKEFVILCIMLVYNKCFVEDLAKQCIYSIYSYDGGISK